MKSKSLWIIGALLFTLAFAVFSFAHGPGGNSQGSDERGYYGHGMMGGNHMMGGMGMWGSNRGGMMEGNGYPDHGWKQNQSNGYDRGNHWGSGRLRDGTNGPKAREDYRNKRSLNPFTWFKNHHWW